MVSPASYASLLADRLEQTETTLRYRDDPVAWAEAHGVHLWSKQQAIANSLVGNRKTAVRSCHDAGKSFLAALTAAWWIDTRPVGDALVVSTAPSYSQIHGIVWEEIRRLHRRLDLPGEVQLSDRWLYDGQMVGLGQRPADYNPHSFQGYHRRWVLVIIDEACGVPAWLWTAVEAITTGDDCRILAIGNPDDPAAHFASLFDPKSGWATEHISAFDTPNLTGEPIPDDLAPLLLPKAWVEEKRTQWGEQSPVWSAKVLGEFPDATENTVIPLSWVRAAQERWRDWQANKAAGTEPVGRRIYGVDVAGEGADEACIATRQGDVVLSVERDPRASNDTMVLAEIVAAKLHAVAQSTAIVDMNGVGTGVVHRLRQLGLNVVPFQAGGGTNRRDATGEWRFKSTRQAAWWNMRELLDPAKGSTIALPPDDQLQGDLTAPRWEVRAGGYLAVEEKSETQKRLGRSPDTGDAVVQAFWQSATAAATEPVVERYDDALDGSVPSMAVSW